MKVKVASFCVGTVIMLGACATVERGSRDTFIVYTTPIAASVTTDMPIENLSSKDKDNQEDSYFGCAPTPCSINMPRRYGFSVLISKEGYLPQSYDVESLRYKELVKRNTQTVVGTTVAAGAITGASIITLDAVLVSLGGVSTGVAASAIAVTALPVAAAGGLSMAVDASSGANRDFYPNPLSIKLIKQMTPEEKDASVQFIDSFDTKRRTQNPSELIRRKRSQP